MGYKLKVGEVVEYMAPDNSNNGSYRIIADKENPYISDLGGIVVAHKDYVIIKEDTDSIRYIHVAADQIKRKRF